jgi:hypothetical protein
MRGNSRHKRTLSTLTAELVRSTTNPEQINTWVTDLITNGEWRAYATSTDAALAAAEQWEIGLSLTLEHRQNRDDGSRYWWSFFELLNGGSTPIATGPTPAIAICRALLLHRLSCAVQVPMTRPTWQQVHAEPDGLRLDLWVYVYVLELAGEKHTYWDEVSKCATLKNGASPNPVIGNYSTSDRHTAELIRHFLASDLSLSLFIRRAEAGFRAEVHTGNEVLCSTVSDTIPSVVCRAMLQHKLGELEEAHA